MARPTRPISWIRAARKDFGKFPEEAQSTADGGKSDLAKPMTQLGSGVFEIALPYKGDALRIVYAVQIGDDLWIIHAFQKKSKSGIKTPKPEIDLIKARIKRLKEELR